MVWAPICRELEIWISLRDVCKVQKRKKIEREVIEEK